MNKIAIALTASLLSSVAFAQSKKPARASGSATPVAASAGSTYRANYGMSGCGLGSVVFSSQKDHNSVGMQIVSSILNNLVFPQTSAMSTGTSNCSDIPSSAALLEQETFVSANFAAITKEAAQGSGARLTAFAEVLGCSDSARFNALSQEKFDVLFAQSEPKSVLQNYSHEVRNDEVLANSCTRVVL